MEGHTRGEGKITVKLNYCVCKHYIVTCMHDLAVCKIFLANRKGLRPSDFERNG